MRAGSALKRKAFFVDEQSLQRARKALGARTDADGVHRFEGTVNQYTGDGIMALFGAPIAHEDHAQRACICAMPCASTPTRRRWRERRSG